MSTLFDFTLGIVTVAIIFAGLPKLSDLPKYVTWIYVLLMITFGFILAWLT